MPDRAPGGRKNRVARLNHAVGARSASRRHGANAAIETSPTTTYSWRFEERHSLSFGRADQRLVERRQWNVLALCKFEIGCVVHGQCPSAREVEYGCFAGQVVHQKGKQHKVRQKRVRPLGTDPFAPFAITKALRISN